MVRGIYFLFFVLIPVIFICQPGYMGKKTTVGGGISLNPAIFGSNANNKTLIGNEKGSAKTGQFRFNTTYELFAERVIGTKCLFGTSVKYIRTGYDNRAKVDLIVNPTDHYKINAFSLNPYFKCYFRHSLAPLGKYFFIGPSLNVILTKHDNYMYLPKTTKDGHDTLLMEFGQNKQMHYSADLILGFGKSRIFNDKVLVDYGFNVGVLSMIYMIEAFDAELQQGTPSGEDYIDRTAKSRVRNASRFNIYLRVAYLF